jgi:5-methylcytosine-specific restriction endonuclease McrA
MATMAPKRNHHQMIASICARHGIHQQGPCPTCTNNREQARRNRPGHRAHHTTRHHQLRTATFNRDGHTCVDCGTTDDLTLDYLTSLEDGGTMSLDNTETRCRSCNSSAGRRPT